ncbi:ubiquitin carboxyl-terminal hydrolase 11-like isoform X3 [Dermacentor variabilis]
MPTLPPVSCARRMDLSLPSTSTCGATAVLCKAPTASPAALTECVQLRPLFCTLSPETERGGELPEEVASGDMGLPEEDTALWPVQEEGGPLSPLFSSLQDAPLAPHNDHTPPTPKGGLLASEQAIPSVRGVCGLRNLGNTCFMNAGLQCLLSNGRLVSYFLARSGEEDAGERGEDEDSLTSQLAHLLRQVWSGSYSCLRPVPFKEALAQACPQFSDCRQHDCQEFLTLLLDTLHEQTNRAGRELRGSPLQGSGSESSTSSWEAAVPLRGRHLPVEPCGGSKYSEAEESAVVGEVRPDSPTAAIAVSACKAPKEGILVNGRCSPPLAKRPRLDEGPRSDEQERRAQEAWDEYTARNQSVVVDTFQGQFRSTVVCSECGHVSVTYEPFMYLPLPLPHAMERQIEVTYVPLGGGDPVPHRVRVPKHEKVRCVVEVLTSQLEEPPLHGMALAELAHNGQMVQRVLDEDMAVRCIGEGDREVFAFALGPWDEEEKEGKEEKEGAKKEEEDCLPPVASARAWHSCAICLEDMADDHLHMHPSCRCLLCRNCLEISCKHYGSDSLMCPLCNLPVKAEGEFVPLSRMSNQRHRSRLVTVPLVFSQEGGQPWRAPTLVRVPCHCPASHLYTAAAAHLPPEACFTLSLVDAWGQRCSRCLPGRCGGCEVARVGWVSLQPGDCLALRCLDDDGPPRSDTWPRPATSGTARPSGSLSLYDCLQAFSESETLDEHNPWFCPVCHRNQRARKTLSIWRSPDTLMVYLKRFVFHEFSGSKVDERVDFPLEALDLEPFVSGPQPQAAENLLYDLHAYICHIGGVNCGHYTAYTRHWTTGEWYHYNDESVGKQPPPRLEEQAHAYILFYQRRSTASEEALGLPGLEPTLPERGAATATFSLVPRPGTVQRVLCRIDRSPPPSPCDSPPSLGTAIGKE